MRKLFPIFAIAVIALAVLAYNQKSKTRLTSNRILEANLFAALNLDRKYIATCGPVRFDYLETSTKAPLFQGMGDHTFSVSNANSESQTYFNQGLNLTYGFMQEFASIPIQAYVRFGQWNEILTIPYPGDNVKHMKLFWHYARGLAFIRKGLLDEAKEELDALENISMDASYDQIYARNENHSGDVADVAYNVVAGEYFAARDDGEMAGKHFKAAIVSEDNLTYTEPPSWHLPVRHNYGAFLVDQKQYEEAEKIYKEDLKVFWDNGWSLIGLHRTYLGQGEESKAKEIKIKFEESWQYADIKITRSVY